MKDISRSLVLLKSGILDCRPVLLEEKGQFYKGSFGIFEILEHSLIFFSVILSILGDEFNPIK